MAKIIEFHIPNSIQKKQTKWIPVEDKGKVIRFEFPKEKSA